MRSCIIIFQYHKTSALYCIETSLGKRIFIHVQNQKVQKIYHYLIIQQNNEFPITPFQFTHTHTQLSFEVSGEITISIVKVPIRSLIFES